MKNNKIKKIYLAGHTGMVGTAILNCLQKKKNFKLILAKRNQLDLTNENKVFNFLKKKKPHFIIIAAAKVGGIKTNHLNQIDFLNENLTIQNNIINNAYKCGIKNLIFLGSSCAFPKNNKNKISEQHLLSNKFEPTNEGYALAKVVGIKLCEFYNKKFGLNYFSLMPCNIFGINDNYNLETSHFLPALIKKIFDAKLNGNKFLHLWGNSFTKRELMYSKDLADAVVYFMNKSLKIKLPTLINIGSGKDYYIQDYAKKIMKILNVKLIIKYSENKNLIGASKKLLDVSLSQKLGWKSKFSLDLALKETIIDYQKKFYN